GSPSVNRSVTASDLLSASGNRNSERTRNLGTLPPANLSTADRARPTACAGLTEKRNKELGLAASEATMKIQSRLRVFAPTIINDSAPTNRKILIASNNLLFLLSDTAFHANASR